MSISRSEPISGSVASAANPGASNIVTMRRWLVFIIALALYVTVSYPYQAVIFPWLGSTPQLTYAVLCSAGVLAIVLYGAKSPIVEYRRPTTIGLAVLTVAMLITLVVCRNPTVIRDLLLLLLLGLLLFRARGELTLRVLRWLTYVSVAALVPALIVVALFNAGLIDWSPWRVERLGLLPGNPLRVRADLADYEYYLPLWISMVPYSLLTDQGFGLNFVRQPLVFIEPTDTWLYTAGLFWLAVADTRMPGRRFCLAVMAIALAVSFSVAGIVATVLAGVMCVAIVVGGRPMILVAAVATLVLPMLVPVPDLLTLLGSNKADQFRFYSENVTVLNTLSVFGNPPLPDEQPLSYGLLIVLDRYGIVGAAALVGVIVAIACIAFRLLADVETLGSRRFPLFIASFVSLAMLVKYPGIIPAMPVLCMAAGLSMRQLCKDPLSRLLLR